MKQFACGSVVPGCTAEFQGENDDEIMRQVAAHAREQHGLDEVPPELAAQVQQQLDAQN